MFIPLHTSFHFTSSHVIYFTSVFIPCFYVYQLYRCAFVTILIKRRVSQSVSVNSCYNLQFNALKILHYAETTQNTQKHCFNG